MKKENIFTKNGIELLVQLTISILSVGIFCQFLELEKINMNFLNYSFFNNNLNLICFFLLSSIIFIYDRINSSKYIKNKNINIINFFILFFFIIYLFFYYESNKKILIKDYYNIYDLKTIYHINEDNNVNYDLEFLYNIVNKIPKKEIDNNLKIKYTDYEDKYNIFIKYEKNNISTKDDNNVYKEISLSDEKDQKNKEKEIEYNINNIKQYYILLIKNYYQNIIEYNNNLIKYFYISLIGYLCYMGFIYVFILIKKIKE